MSLAPGSRLGPYEITTKLGEGGMGEVWRAIDSRLRREVAIKVLPAAFTADPERLARFEREAQLLAQLQHSNIAAIYGLEESGGTRALVMELVDGEELAVRIARGALPLDEALPIARQIAEALEAAHEKGIVHRDLKPQNIKVAPDGTVKVLDFGLAKAMEPEAGASSAADLARSPTLMNSPTLTAAAGTALGMILGTAAYMAPEQARGKAVDKRADIWAFGVVLYEMLCGGSLFAADTVSDTIAAVLTREPDWSAAPATTPPRLIELLRHCLEKNARDRLRDIGDARIVLKEVGQPSPPPAVGRLRRPGRSAAAAALLFAVALCGGYLAARWRGSEARPPVLFEQKSFRRQAIFNARFAPDGQTIVFSASRTGGDSELFVVRPDYPEPSAIGASETHLLAVSSRNELAVLTHARWVGHHRIFRGTLARVPLGGGTPRELLAGVREADWSPDGSQLAILREAEGKDRLEYPIGTVLYETAGYLSDLRVAASGDRIAVLEHPTSNFDDRGGVTLIDRSGHRRSLTDGYWGIEGLAWSPSGEELLFSAASTGGSYEILAVDLAGRVRRTLPAPGNLTLLDISREGTWLASSDDLQTRIMVRPPGASEERDLSWLDSSLDATISRDGRSLVFTDQSEEAGPNYRVSFRKTDGSPAVHLGEGAGRELSPDGAWVLASVPSAPDKLMLYPTGPGEPRRLDHGELSTYSRARWIGEGRSILVCGSENGRASRCFVRPVEGGALRALAPEGAVDGVVSADGRQAVVRSASGDHWICDLPGGDARPLPFLGADDSLIRWSPDGTRIWTFKQNRLPIRIDALDPATGQRQLLTEIVPRDRAGALSILSLSMADDPGSYAYTAWEYSSRLFEITGAE